MIGNALSLLLSFLFYSLTKMQHQISQEQSGKRDMQNLSAGSFCISTCPRDNSNISAFLSAFIDFNGINAYLWNHVGITLGDFMTLCLIWKIGLLYFTGFRFVGHDQGGLALEVDIFLEILRVCDRR